MSEAEEILEILRKYIVIKDDRIILSQLIATPYLFTGKAWKLYEEGMKDFNKVYNYFKKK